MNVWKLMQRRASERDQQPAELAERESELEMRTKSRPGAELPSAPSELQQHGEVKTSNALKKQVNHHIDKNRMLLM